MKKRFSVLIFGDGRVARATAHYFLKRGIKASFFSKDSRIPRFDLLVGALPGELGEKCLALALKYKKNLIDISDVDPPFYLRHKKEIQHKGIIVVPGCGFSPGLVNCIIGRELHANSKLSSIEVKAGSLSQKRHYYPFLWCFEDLILEHRIPSWQKLVGKKIKLPAFAEFRREQFFGIEAESYFCASGFENLIDDPRIEHFTCRVVRPAGFREFFYFLDRQGFLKKENLLITKGIVESQKEDNLTLAEITFSGPDTKTVWLLKSFSKKGERLNSMQKITASVPAAIGMLIFEGKINASGLRFMDEVGRDEVLFKALLAQIRYEGISCTRKSYA